MTLKTLVRILILTLCVVFLMIPVTAEVVIDVVNIPDANLRAAVHKTLNQPSTAIITVAGNTRFDGNWMPQRQTSPISQDYTLQIW